MLKKQCTACNELLPLSDFHKRPASKDGLRHTCKKCHCAEAKLYRIKNIEEVRKKDKERSKRKNRQGESKRYRAKYPEKYIAHKAVCLAVQKGEIKMLPCEVCGNERSHAHHDDYEKPLEIRWLCSIHHAEHHSLLNKKEELPNE